MIVEAQGAEAQMGGLAEQVEELGRVQAEVAVVDAELMVGIGARGQGEIVQLLLDALALGLGGMERAADVLAGVLVAEVRDGHAAGLAANVMGAPAPHAVLRGGAGVVERALQARLKVQHELLELAHDAGQGGGVGVGVGVARFRVAGSSVSFQQGHWGRRGQVQARWQRVRPAKALRTSDTGAGRGWRWLREGNAQGAARRVELSGRRCWNLKGKGCSGAAVQRGAAVASRAVNKQRPLVVAFRVHTQSAQGWHRIEMDKETRNMALLERPTEILLSTAAGIECAPREIGRACIPAAVCS